MYTVEVYKRDRRSKLGERLVRKTDHSSHDPKLLEHLYSTTYFARDGYRFKIYETMVTRKNLMTGNEYQERADTPLCCSPSSETYWSS